MDASTVLEDKARSISSILSKRAETARSSGREADLEAGFEVAGTSDITGAVSPCPKRSQMESAVAAKTSKSVRVLVTKMACTCSGRRCNQSSTSIFRGNPVWQYAVAFSEEGQRASRSEASIPRPQDPTNVAAFNTVGRASSVDFENGKPLKAGNDTYVEFPWEDPGALSVGSMTLKIVMMTTKKSF